MQRKVWLLDLSFHGILLTAVTLDMDIVILGIEPIIGQAWCRPLSTVVAKVFMPVAVVSHRLGYSSSHEIS